MRCCVLWGLLSLAALPAAAQSPVWLDKPLTSWNTAGAAVPKAPPFEEPKATIVSRCRLQPPTSPGAQQLEAAGWIPFLNFGKPLTHGDVDVVGGMSAADGMCRPAAYNVFVFVKGRFAGTLSPVAMTSRLDASSGEVTADDTGLTAGFSRYVPSDALCCPSGRMLVRYRIDRGAAGPVVVATSVRPDTTAR